MDSQIRTQDSITISVREKCRKLSTIKDRQLHTTGRPPASFNKKPSATWNSNTASYVQKKGSQPYKTERPPATFKKKIISYLEQ